MADATSSTAANETAIAIAIVCQGDQYLIGQRSEGSVLAGYWEFPGGKVRPGESPAAAAVRECCEETGLPVRAGELLAEVEHAYPHGRLRLYFFRCAVVEPAAAPTGSFRWVSANELDARKFPPANRTVIAQLLGE